MAIQILMPALSPTMTEGKLAKWLKKEGDAITSGDVLAEIETDKATMEVEAVDEGILQKILVQEGTENVAVNTPIAVLENGGATAQPAPTNGSKHATAPVAQMEKPVQPKTIAAPAPKPVGTEMAVGTTRKMTVREALRDAMAEEMRRGGRGFLMGEEGAE